MNQFLKGKIVEKYGSQIEFARVLGEHESIVSRVVRGHRDLDPEERTRWANMLGFDDPERLFQK